MRERGKEGGDLTIRSTWRKSERLPISEGIRERTRGAMERERMNAIGNESRERERERDQKGTKDERVDYSSPSSS